MTDHLAAILSRKALEVARRRAHPRTWPDDGLDRGPRARAALRRTPGAPLKVVAEIKRRSPSAGLLRARRPGDIEAVSRAYVEAGASAVSVLADGPGFGGSVLDVRRACISVSAPVLFKEFVIDDVQVRAARAAGASLVLLLVRALPGERLRRMVAEVRAMGMEPLVEAADVDELSRALSTDATVVGVNARDLRRFTLDPEGAERALREVPNDRIAVYMSGVENRARMTAIALGRPDAVLLGTELMRAPCPGARLAEILGAEGP